MSTAAADMTPRKGGLILPYDGIWPDIHPEAFVAENAVVIGRVKIGKGSGIWYGCVLRGDVNEITVGEDTNIQDGTVVHVNRPRTEAEAGSIGSSGGAVGLATHIGDRVTVGHMALLHACVIETGGFIGMKAVVLDGSVVEGDAMVAAGAMVTPNKRVPTGELWAGSPAKKMRELSKAEIDGFLPQAEHYARLGAKYRAL